MEKIKNNQQCYVIAEAGLNHNGSVEIAKKLIDVAVIAGADAVKFQKRSVDKLAIKEVLDAKDDRFPDFGGTYRQIREYLEFDFDQYIELKQYSESKHIDFMVTAFDEDAVDFLLKVGVKKFKLASHSLTNLGLVEYLAKRKLQTVISTGMASLDEIDSTVDIFKSNDTPFELMHCVSAYPTPLSECNLAMMDVLRNRYQVNVGYSGHEIGYLPSVIAVARGAQLIERHFTLDKSMVGFDHKISLEPDELIAMIRDIRLVKNIVGDGEKTVSDTELITRKKYHVSMAASQEIKAGTILTDKMVTYRNPGTGIPYKHASKVLGKRTTIHIPEDTLIDYKMFE